MTIHDAGVLDTSIIAALGRQPRKRAADLMIAAVAASNALPLYTANLDDFHGSERFVELVGAQGRPNKF